MAQRCIGIQIDEQHILCIEAKGSTNSLAVEKIGSIPLPAGAIAGGIIENPNLIASLLEPLLEKMDISTHIASINIPSALCQIKSFPFEQGYDTISDTQLSWETSKHIGQPVEQFLIDKFQSGQQLIIVAARKDQINIRKKILLLAGLTPQGIYPDTIATFDALVIARGVKAQPKTIVVDVQVPHSTIILFVQGNFHFGGLFFTPPELFGISSGKYTWNEWAEDTKSAITLALESYRFINPAFVADELLFTGRPVADNIQSRIAQNFGINLVMSKEVLQRRVKIKPKKSDFQLSELFVPIGLTTSAFNGGKSGKIGKD